MVFNVERSFQENIRAKKVIPGGVNSPVRAFNAVGEHPIVISQGKGSHIIDVDGNDYIDYVCSWGPLILGHCNNEVKESINKRLELGSTFGMPTEIETLMAEKICSLIDSIDMVRMVSSGTEATMSALRLARGYTNRDKIIKFQGCYHGHADHLLIQAGSGALTFGVPSSPGVPDAIAQETLSAVYNDIDSVKKLFKEYPDDIAAIIVEPIAGNMGLIPPKDGFLSELRELTEINGSLLIFDEVISGFRASLNGAQKIYNIKPDLTCLGKIIGGGLPVGAFGGRRDIMEKLAPVGSIYQAGTLSGNPLAMSAGYTTLEVLERTTPYELLDEKARKLADGLRLIANKNNVDVTINQMGSLLTIFFKQGQVSTYAEAQESDVGKFSVFFNTMLSEGIHLPPSQFECLFLSTEHTEDDIKCTLLAAEKAIAAVGRM